MTPGFEFKETMTGTYTMVNQKGPKRRFSLTARMVVPNAITHLKTGLCELEGVVDMEGFADEVPVRGTLEIAPIRKRQLRYEFAFVANDGSPYRFAGQKDLRLSDLVGSMTTLIGAIHDNRGEEVAQAQLKFDLKTELLPFLVSFKPSRKDGCRAKTCP